MSSTRDFAIDVEKGIFLLLIVIGHLWNIPDSVKFLLMPTDLIYVPIFFFLSGLLFKKDKYSFREFVSRKAKTLLLPYFSFFILFCICDWNLYLNTESFLLNAISSLVYGNGPSKALPLWFVSTLFFSSILLYVAASAKTRMLKCVIIGIYFSSFIFCDFYHVHLLFSIHRAAGGALIMYSGWLIKNTHLLNFEKNILFHIICFVIMGVGIYMHIGLLNEYTNHSLLSFPSSICGCIFITALSKRWLSKKHIVESFFTWLAKNGIIVLSVHYYIVCCISNVLKHNGIGAWISFFVQLFSVFLSIYLIIPLLKKIKPALWGFK